MDVPGRARPDTGHSAEASIRSTDTLVRRLMLTNIARSHRLIIAFSRTLQDRPLCATGCTSGLLPVLVNLAQFFLEVTQVVVALVCARTPRRAEKALSRHVLTLLYHHSREHRAIMLKLKTTDFLQYLGDLDAIRLVRHVQAR